ncbi:hypothetical protein JCM6882_003307 [Rhodosporidiobolus microsporus]
MLQETSEEHTPPHQTPQASTSALPIAPDPPPLGALSPAILTSIARSRRAIRKCIVGAEQEDQPPSVVGAAGGVAAARLLKSCAACRALKVRCAGGEPCPRCVKKGIECQYTERKKLGRRITNPKTKKLYELQTELDRLYALVNGQRSTSTEPNSEDSPQSVPEEEEDDSLYNILTNPLGLLTLDAAPTPAGNSSIDEPAGLFDHVLDTDPALDPVNLGLLTEGEFERFLTFYFDSLQSYLFLLDPALHTSLYIRRVSPFLATVVALNSAMYDSSAAHLIQPLEQHASDLAARSFTYGHKSMEVVLAYCLWAPWSPIPASLSLDRSWRNVGQAVRIASEIRLDLPLHPTLCQQYARLMHPYPLSPALLNQARLRTQELVFCLDVALSSQTGRMHTLLPNTLHGSSLQPLPPAAEQQLQESAPFLSRAAIQNLHAANLSISRYFSRALLLHAEMRSRRPADTTGLRDKFVAAWKGDLIAWDREFAGVRELPYLSRLNRHILLLSYSLHFPGPVEPILTECQQIAVTAASYVCDWFAAEPRIVYASNFVIINISYSASFLQFSRKTPSSIEVEADPARLELCERVVQILSTIGAVRPHGRSLATVYAENLRALLRQDSSPKPSAPFLPDTASYSPLPLNAAPSHTIPRPPTFEPFPALQPAASTVVAAGTAPAAPDLPLPDLTWPDINAASGVGGTGLEGSGGAYGGAGMWEQNNPVAGWTTGASDWDQLFSWLPPSMEEATRPPPM